ncbi:uncharacterized protein LOC109810937 [Cajanus cajan]|uniref:uncharacterized protein LOC109810937 n=1 Tax=Cajanus cajan TaxID=3821 RepID=UPI00098D8330|nr:uncharacterized protein LOC109810937 [Cajanus cajan]
MAGRNDCAIADALQALAQAVSNNNRAEVAPNWLEQFQRNNPPTFKGGYDPDVAMNWLMEIEKIFNAMECPLAQKVRLATFMLTADAHFWWEGALQRMIDGGVQLNWDNFKKVFLEKYFPDDVRSQKEVEFLELKQGNDTVAELGRFITTRRLSNKSRIYGRDNRARAVFYKGAGGPMRAASSSALGKSKPYSAPAKIQGNHAKSRSVAGNSFVGGAANVGGSVSTPTSRCKKCGLRGHEHYNCPDKEITCFNCNGKGHISTQCPQPPRQRMMGTRASSQPKRPKTTGRVFALSGAEAAQSDNLIQEAVEVAEAPVAEAPVAESCNVMELVPCADAFTSITPPSPECCQRLKEQPPPCICLYMNDPTLKGFINTPNAKMVSDTCGSPMPNNC